jgi:hypothetical protein
MTETKSNLQEYFNKIENNLKYDPFAILHSCILGGAFMGGDEKAQALARQHVANCVSMAANNDLYKALQNNGCDLTECPEISLLAEVLTNRLSEKGKILLLLLAEGLPPELKNLAETFGRKEE